MSYWRVTFEGDGKVGEVVPVEGEPERDWVIVEAETAAQAERKAFNLYCARKKRLRVRSLHAEGRCSCGRVQDRPRPGGGFLKTCSTCQEYRRRDHARRRQKGFTPQPRDEVARVAAYQERVRDRKAEIRLEVLLEVRRWWKEAPHTLAFAERLKTEIESAGGRAPAAANDPAQACA